MFVYRKILRKRKKNVKENDFLMVLTWKIEKKIYS